MKRIETMVDLFTHLITRNDETPFNKIWDFYFKPYHQKFGIGNMNQEELKKWLLEEVGDVSALNKLSKIEDLMEEYGIENLEELERHLGYTVEYDIITRLEYERDIWKKACELAVGVLRYNRGYSAIKDDLYYLKNNSTYEHCFRNPKTVDYFYQQAKEKKDDN